MSRLVHVRIFFVRAKLPRGENLSRTGMETVWSYISYISRQRANLGNQKAIEKQRDRMRVMRIQFRVHLQYNNGLVETHK